MKRFLKICVVMFVFFTFISCEENDGVITVNGTGEITFLPDVINLRVEIKNIDANLGNAGNKTKATLAEFSNICNTYSIAHDDIQTSSIRTGKENEYNSETRKYQFVGYYSEVTIMISVRDFSNFEEFSGLLLNFDDLSIRNFQFTHSDIKKYESDADLLALDNAKLSAEKIAEHMGLKLENILDISYETTRSSSSVGLPYDDRLYFSSSLVGGGGIPVSPGILTLSKQVQIKYKVIN